MCNAFPGWLNMVTGDMLCEYLVLPLGCQRHSKPRVVNWHGGWSHKEENRLKQHVLKYMY